MDNRKKLGEIGENIAHEHLKSLGYKLVVKNYRIRTGEIDLIMTDKNTLVFIEVRTKSTSFFGSPAETVNYKKQKVIINTANFFLYNHPVFQDSECRFDVVGIVINNQSNPEINHIKDAFIGH